MEIPIKTDLNTPLKAKKTLVECECVCVYMYVCDRNHDLRHWSLLHKESLWSPGILRVVSYCSLASVCLASTVGFS